jgi:hypothetical protein
VDLDEETGEEIYSERKVNALKETAMIVYIKRDADYLASKIAGDSNRPTLSETNSFKEIMERRGPWYERAADLILDGSLESGSGGSNENNKNTNNETTVLVKKKKIGKEILRYFYAKAGIGPLDVAGFYEIGGAGSVEPSDIQRFDARFGVEVTQYFLPDLLLLHQHRRFVICILIILITTTTTAL